MISFEDITKLFSFDIEEKMCIEVEFCIKGEPAYSACWMGKMPDDDKKGKEIYWYGLKPDGSAAYDYDCHDDFFAAPVFDGRSLKEIWAKVEILSIDGMDPGVYLVCIKPPSGWLSVCRKTVFSTDWQRSIKPGQQTNRTRRRTDGTEESGLCSKSKCLRSKRISHYGSAKISRLRQSRRSR